MSYLSATTPKAREEYAAKCRANAEAYRAQQAEARRLSNARFTGVVVFLAVLTFGLVSALLS